MELMNRKGIADIIFSNLEVNEDLIKESALKSLDKIGYFYLDDLLPVEFVKILFSIFPKTNDTMLRKNIREFKYVGFQMDKYHSILEEIIYAFQDQRIVNFIGDIFNLNEVYPDPSLYAGGISIMKKNNFLNPHIDNSHDDNQKRWRVLNLLYYVTPNWQENFGGNLEIWNNGLDKEQVTIHSKFNRLIVMVTHNSSWHSVSPIKYDGRRCCISNYYFSNSSVKNSNEFHITSFRARPNHKIQDLILRFDSKIRMFIRKLFNKGIVENTHIYKK